MKEMINIRQLRILTLVIIVATLIAPHRTYATQIVHRTINVDGSPIQASIIIQNNYQMVPAIWFRSISSNVTWSERYRSAVVSNNETVIGFPESQSFADYDPHQSNQWERDNLNTTSFIHDGRMYVPLAFTARKLGMKVTYHADSKTTSIQHAEIATLKSTQQELAPASSATPDDLYWLNQITEAEAGGESYNGKLAVAASILNRVESPDWPDSIRDTIFQVTTFNGVSYHQFSPVLDNRIHTVTPSKDTIKAVQAALNGEDSSEGAVVFYNPDKTDNKWVRSREVTVTIGNHVFAK